MLNPAWSAWPAWLTTSFLPLAPCARDLVSLTGGTSRTSRRGTAWHGMAYLEGLLLAPAMQQCRRTARLELPNWIFLELLACNCGSRVLG